MDIDNDKKYGLTTRIRISNAIDKETWKRLKDYSNKTSIPVSKLLDKSIQMYLDSIENNKN